MPIHFATETINGSALVQKGLDRLARRESPLSAMKLDFTAMKIQPPQAVYDLRADAVAGGGGLASAAKTGLRYLVQNKGANVAAAEVVARPTDVEPLLANINYGPYVEATARALDKVAALPAVAAKPYEARLLRFSAIGLMALWLKSESDAKDIVYPLEPAPAGLEANKAYSEVEFIKIILPLAQKRAEQKEPGLVP